MYNNASAEFITAINRLSRTFRSRITVNGSVISDIKSYTLVSGSCGSEAFSIGTVFSAYVNLTLPIQDTSFADQEMYLETGVVKDNDTVEYIPMGYFTAIPSDIVKSRDQIVIKASDRITSKCRRGYLASVSFPASIGTIINDISTQIGCTIITSFSTSGIVDTAFPIMTCAEALGHIAGLLGGFCYADRNGNIRIEPFPDEAALDVSKDRIFRLSANESEYALNRLSVTVSVGGDNLDGEEEEPVIYSAGSGEGLDLYNPYMTQALFNALATRMLGYSFSPGTVDFLGDPRLDPIDVIAAQNYEDTEYIIPCMDIIQTFDGGLKTTVSAPGIVSSDQFAQGPLTQQVESLETDMTMAKKAVDVAKASAISATNSANSALVQLSVVEDVAGTLKWISDNGSFNVTTDTTVQQGTVYFIYENGDFIPIVNPDTSKNPHEEGWYILDVTDSQASFIMAHLAVTDAGLWILPVDQLVPHNLVDSSGNNLVDSDDNQLIDWSKDEENIQNAVGYKVLISGETTDNHLVGLTIYDDTGTAVANYGVTTTIGALSGFNTHIKDDGFYVRNGTTVLAKYGSTTKFYEPDGVTEAAEIGADGMYVKAGQIGSWTLEDGYFTSEIPVYSDNTKLYARLTNTQFRLRELIYSSARGAYVTNEETIISRNNIQVNCNDYGVILAGSTINPGNIELYNMSSECYAKVQSGTFDAVSLYCNQSGYKGLYDGYLSSYIIERLRDGSTYLVCDNVDSSFNVRLAYDDASHNVFQPSANNSVYCGTGSRRWQYVYGNYVVGSHAYNNDSDLKKKAVIEDYDWKVDDFIRGLKPIAYKWKKEDGGVSNRIKYGFGAQDVAGLAKDLDIGDLSLYQAKIHYIEDGKEIEKDYHGEDIDDSKLEWSLAYSELIAPMVLEMQRLMNRVDKLEEENAMLRHRLDKIEEMLGR